MVVAGFGLMVAGLAFFITAWILSSRAARQLVDFQYRNHHDLWLRESRPVGGTSTRGELSFLGSDLATILFFQRLAFRRPDWLPADSEGERFRVAMVRWGWYSLIGLTVGVAGGFLFFGEVVRAA